MSLYLSKDELIELTEREQSKAQCRVLKMMGVDFIQHPFSGRPKVLRSDLMKPAVTKQRSTATLNMDAF